MLKFATTVRFAALGALALGFASLGFAANASADELKNVTDVSAPGHQGDSATTGHGSSAGAANAASSATGEGALSSGSCFADMPVYNKEGQFVGRGIVNTCK